MSVVSYIFIVFLAVTVLIYYIVPKKIQWWVLLAASAVFYAYSGIDDLLIVVGTAFLVYPLTMLMEKNLEEQDRLLLDADKRTARKIKTAQKKKRKKYLVLALLIVIGALIVFKVTGFAIENIKRFLPYEAIQRIPDWHFPAPLGVSFYSFMMISYLVDVYNGRIHAQKNFLKYLSYVLYFPHITQGPIARYELVAHQLWEKHKFDYDTVIKGTWLILWGALKKMVMADRISPFVTEVFKHSDQYEGMIFFLAAVMYSIQIYCDFSGCMDIVRGASECFGITLGENFRSGVLEKMAYFTRSVLQRICILSGIDFKDPVEMEYQGAEISGKCHRNWICFLCTDPVRMDSDRTLAWGKVELYRLGTVSRNPDLLIDII